MKSISFAICLFGVLLTGCFKTKTYRYYPPEVKASKMGGMRSWHFQSHPYWSDNLISLPDTSFALIIINDSVVQFPGNSFWSNVNISYTPARYLNGVQEFDGPLNANYLIKVYYRPSKDSIGIWMQDVSGTLDTVYLYNSI